MRIYNLILNHIFLIHTEFIASFFVLYYLCGRGVAEVKPQIKWTPRPLIPYLKYEKIDHKNRLIEWMPHQLRQFSPTSTQEAKHRRFENFATNETSIAQQTPNSTVTSWNEKSTSEWNLIIELISSFASASAKTYHHTRNAHTHTKRNPLRRRRCRCNGKMCQVDM